MEFFLRALETLSGDGDDRFRTRLSSTRRRVARKRGIYAGTHIRDTFAELTHSGIVVCIFFCTRGLFLSLFLYHHHREFCARVMLLCAFVCRRVEKRRSKEHAASRREELSCFWTSEEEALNVACD